MSAYDHGPLRSYEIVWRTTGHVEVIQAHSVIWPDNMTSLFGVEEPGRIKRIKFMGEIDGQWTLVLQADEDDIKTVRDVTASERLPQDGAA